MSAAAANFIVVIVVCFLVYYSSAEGDGSFNDALQYYGRFMYNASSNRLEANWPNSGFKFLVLQESHHDYIQIDIIFSTYADSHYYVNAYLNCEFYSKHLISSNQSMVSLQVLSKVNTSKTIHHFDFQKVTEASYSNAKGMMSLVDINVANGRVISEDMAVGLLGQQSYYNNNKKCRVHNKHKMLIIGDSLTAAYGVDGNDPCMFDASLEDVTHGYAYIVAKELQADLHTIAWSGKGVVRNYGDINQLSIEPMPVYYNRTIATIAVTSNSTDFPDNYWNPSLFPADIIIVMLGSNDYSTTPHPNDEDFIEGLVTLIDQIKIDYPDAINHIVLMCAPHNNGNQCMNIEETTRKTLTRFISIDPDVYDGGYGCDLHPNVLTQQYMADIVAPLIKAMLLQ